MWASSAGLRFEFLHGTLPMTAVESIALQIADRIVHSRPRRVPVPMPGGWGSLLRESRCIEFIPPAELRDVLEAPDASDAVVTILFGRG